MTINILARCMHSAYAVIAYSPVDSYLGIKAEQGQGTELLA